MQPNYRTPDTNRRSAWDVVFRPFNLYFLTRVVREVMRGSSSAGTDNFYRDYVEHCGGVLRAVEATGGRVEIFDLGHIPREPVVFVGNHISTLETLVLGHILRDHGMISFVIKENLMKYPYFKDILRELKCITVTRTQPARDLKAILRKGPELLKQGISVVVFPQRTRGAFHPEEFNYIGCMLAKRAGVPVVPLALDTRFWWKGKLISDLGPLRRKIPVRFAFGEPLTLGSDAKEVHRQCVDFIGERLRQWGAVSG